MKKIVLSIIVLIISISAIIYIANDNQSEFSSLCIDESSFDELCESHTLSNISLLNEIYFDDNKILLDNKNNRFYYSIVNNEYNPIVKWSEHVNVSFLGDINENNIKNNNVVHVIAYDDSKYSLYELICTNLPLLNIEYNNVIENINLSLFDNNKNKTYNYSGTMHPRGNSTLAYPKLGYKIKLKDSDEKTNDISLLDLRVGTDYILYAGYNDQERIRNVFSMDLWWQGCRNNNSVDVDSGMYYKYVELFLNNEYWGLYALGFPIDEIQYSLKQDEVLYFKWDNFDEKEVFVGGNDLSLEDAYEIKAGPNDSSSYDTLNDYYDTILHSNNVDDIYSVCDIDNAIDIYLFTGLVMGSDSSSLTEMKDIFMCKKNNDNGYKFVYAPWDKDITWGNHWRFDEKNYTYEYHLPFDDVAHSSPLQNSPISRLVKIDKENTSKLLKERYNYLRNNEWSDDKVIGMLNNYESAIFDSGAYQRDIERWQDSNQIEPELKLSNFKQFVLNRLKFVDDNFEKIYINY